MKPEDRRPPYYHIVRRILMVIAFLGLAFYVLLIVWVIYQLVMVGVGWYDVTYRQSKSAVPPKGEDLRALSLVPAWQYEADTRLYRIVGVAEDKLVIFTHSNRFVGIDMASGEKSWEYQSPGDITNLVTEDEIALKDGLLVFSCFVNDNILVSHGWFMILLAIYLRWRGMIERGPLIPRTGFGAVTQYLLRYE